VPLFTSGGLGLGRVSSGLGLDLKNLVLFTSLVQTKLALFADVCDPSRFCEDFCMTLFSISVPLLFNRCSPSSYYSLRQQSLRLQQLAVNQKVTTHWKISFRKWLSSLSSSSSVFFISGRSPWITYTNIKKRKKKKTNSKHTQIKRIESGF